MQGMEKAIMHTHTQSRAGAESEVNQSFGVRQHAWLVCRQDRAMKEKRELANETEIGYFMPGIGVVQFLAITTNML